MISSFAKPQPLHSRIVSGSLVLLTGSGLTAGLNLAYNVAVARFLGPDGFGQATAVYTLLTLVSAITLSYQTMAAKAVARMDGAADGAAAGEDADLRAYNRSAWAASVLVAVMLIAFRGGLQAALHLSQTDLLLLLAAGSLFYIPLGVRRGRVQGAYGFRGLAANLVLEGVFRLGGSALAAGLGYGVKGVIAANALAVAAAYLAIAPTPAPASARPVGRVRFGQAHRELAQALVFFSGQVLINNCDIVLVKHFFSPVQAGLYAVVAMVGRVVFALCQAVVNSMVPVVAGTGTKERESLRLIATSLLLVLGIGAALSAALLLAPSRLWSGLFGSGFAVAGFPALLALYALTSVVYSLSAVMIAYEMSYKIAYISWVQLLFSGLIVAGICRFHASLAEVILVQLVLVSVMLLPVATPFLRGMRRGSRPSSGGASASAVRLVRRVSEDEVVAEFLKSDFFKADYRAYHETLQETVYTPDLGSREENARRRALLATRHLALWQELPGDTEWWEAEFGLEDYDRVRVFPRAQWRKLAGGDFAIRRVAEQLGRRGAFAGRLTAKIAAIRAALAGRPAPASAVLLIGTSAAEPLVVIDGNHRMVAAVLEGRTEGLRFFCGLSPKMRRCCWYNTSPLTLARYLGHLLRHLARSPEAELALQLGHGPRPSSHGTQLPAGIPPVLRATK